jgi:hypothetical protein
LTITIVTFDDYNCVTFDDYNCVTFAFYGFLVLLNTNIFLGQRPLVPLLLLGLPFFPIVLFGSTTLLTGMTGISLHMQLASDFSVARQCLSKRTI